MAVTVGELRVAPAPAVRVPGALRAAVDAVTLSYAQLLFSRSRRVGAVLLLATALSPRSFALGLGSVALALATARALRLAPETARSGALSYNALLVGVTAAATLPATHGGHALLAAAVVLSVLVTAALNALLGARHGLPALSMPFLAAYYLVLGALPPVHAPTVLFDVPFAGYFKALGCLLYLPRADAGMLVFAALLLHSRVAAMLTAVAWATVSLAAPLAGVSASLLTTLGLNAMLAAVAAGGVWFVPSAWSYGLAAVTAAVTAAVGAGLAARMDRVGAPLLITPFNLTVPLLLYVMRQRVADGRPHAVDFTPGTPEENLAYHRARAERFGELSGVRIAPPFRGRWRCTQGVEGGVTHEGPWRHALDFEVFHDDGLPFAGEGRAREDFACYKLPILAPAAGVVARVVEGIPDNAIGEVNLDDNWGNAVIVRHADGLYSCVAHLSPGTVAVREGQAVAQGETLGLCGNSGRSATPHLHLQLQRTPELGAATVPLALHDAVVVTRAGATLRAAVIPAAGEELRPVGYDHDRAALLRFHYGVRLRATLDDGRAEDLIADIDLLGRQLLRSTRGDAALYYAAGAGGFTVLDVVGDPGSALHALRAALSRVPFDAEPGITWEDRLPLRPFLPAWLRPFFDVVSPFGGPSSLVMRYTTRTHGAAVWVEGASVKTDRRGRPWVTTAACMLPGAGVVRVDLRVRDRKARVELAPLSSVMNGGVQ